MSFWKKLGTGVKKLLPLAAVAAPFIPGVGPAVGGLISKIGGMWGGSSAKDSAFTGPPDPGNPTEGQQVTVTDKAPPFNWSKAIGDAVPGVVSGLAGYYGQKQANAANAKAAQAQMDFQAEQTGSSYQRGVADMKAAGLNPMLAYSQGGAASGGGASYQSGSELGSGVNSAQSAMLAKAQMAATVAQIENVQADTHNKEQSSDNINADTTLKLAQGVNEKSRNGQIVQDIIARQLANQLADETMPYNIASAKHGASYAESRAQGEKYSLAEKSAWSKFYGSTVGKAYPYVSKATEQSNSAANVFRKFIPFTND